MGLALQLPNIHHHLVALFCSFMSRPPLTDVPGLFILHSGYEVDTRGWRDMLRDHAGSCKLQRIEFCKTRSDKLHEFLVLYFSHHTHPSTSAVVIVDRAAQESSQTSAIVSPSLPFKKTTPALDKVHVMGQNVSLDAYLSHTYGKYNTLCVLEYPSPSDLDSSTPQPPSAIQLSILLLAVTEHKSDYNLYEHNCYWFADMVFEASKKLFPGHREVCYKHEDRGRCRLNIAMLASATPALEAICREYDSEWGRHVQMRGLGRDGINQHVSPLFGCSYY